MVVVSAMPRWGFSGEWTISDGSAGAVSGSPVKTM
jgi:hypothetical protein